MPMLPEAEAADRARLLELLRKFSFEQKPVKLSSGTMSDFYIDSKRTTLMAEGHFLVGRCFLQVARRLTPTVRAIGGLTLGADPLASAVALTSFIEGNAPLDAFIVRKEAKNHGTRRFIESPNLPQGTVVAVLEDVVTTGESALLAVQRCRDEGYVVAGVLALVDRNEGGREAIEAQDLTFVSLFERKDFIPWPTG